MALDNHGRLIGRCVDWISAGRPRPCENDLDDAIEVAGERITEQAAIEPKMDVTPQQPQASSSFQTHTASLNPSELKPTSWSKGNGKGSGYIDQQNIDQSAIHLQPTQRIDLPQTFNQTYPQNQERHHGNPLFVNAAPDQHGHHTAPHPEALRHAQQQAPSTPAQPRVHPRTPTRHPSAAETDNSIRMAPLRLQTPLPKPATNAPASASPPTLPNNWVFLRRLAGAQSAYNSRNAPY